MERSHLSIVYAIWNLPSTLQVLYTTAFVANIVCPSPPTIEFGLTRLDWRPWYTQ